ncbi:MAG: MFS transporter [Firmicutes bacterium]|nr:MFS transporter [Bacillota bacterium]
MALQREALRSEVLRPDKTLIPRAIRLLATAMFLWGFGYGLHAYMFPVYLRNIGCTPSQVGVVFSVSMAATAASCIPGGALADRYDRRKVILLTWLAGAPSPILYYLARDYRMAAVGIALYSGSLLGYPALNAYAASSAAAGASGTAFGVMNVGFAAGMIASPLVGGYVADAWGPKAVFLLSFVFFLAASCVMAFLPPERREAESEAGAGRRGSGSGGYRGLLRDRPFMRFVALYSVCAFAYYMIQPLISQYLADVRSGSMQTISMLGTLMSLGQALITAVVARAADRRGAVAAVGANLLVFVLSLLCFVLVPSAAVTLVCLFLLGGFMAGQGVVYAGVGEILGDRTDGRAFALFSLAMSTVSIFGPYMGGAVYDRSRSTPFHLAAGIVAVGGLLLVKEGLAIRSGRGGGLAEKQVRRTHDSTTI